MDTLLRLQQCLLPPPEIVRWKRGALELETCSTPQKIAHCTKNFFAFTALLLASPFTLAYDFYTAKEISPLKSMGPPTLPAWPPEQRGFASSLFQTSGLGTKWAAAPKLEGRGDWDKWMDNPKHILHPEGFDFNDFFVDVLTDPTAYIAMLKSQNATAHRFSLEWSVIEPSPGNIDWKAVFLYRQFIKALQDAGITPSVTLCHFVIPEWFHQAGSFQQMDNIDRFVEFGLKAMELFPDVKDWWSFNELGVRAYQQAREVFPTDLPEGSSLSQRAHATGISTRNMLIAHCKLHQKVAELHPDKKIGVTHQWLTFDAASNNWLESLVGYFMSKVTFTPVYQFFKEGRYCFQLPFMANIQFEIPVEEFEANGRFLMRLGVQAYPKTYIKMGLNYGETYPGHETAVKNLPLFTFGATCEPGGTVMRFAPRWKADEIDSILDEAFALTDEVFITEYGSDATIQRWGESTFKLDGEAQANYLQQLTERIERYCQENHRSIKGLFCWSDLRRQMEWDNGFECKLGTIDPILDGERRMIGWKTHPAADYLKTVFQGAQKAKQNVS